MLTKITLPINSTKFTKLCLPELRGQQSFSRVRPALNPDLWKKYRMNLQEYLEHSIYFEPISSELFLIDILISKNPENLDEAIIDEYAKTMKNSKNTPNTKLSM
ncbi:hypothetical protein C2G38_2191860 [Gigaspora rosea]|uniref:Uncharacterized protein n=1 Tax=Gigaspora rosea TaxID=44941 RepID=A0A397UZN7_9GLOM|nr:hypothetical protein C2G38_2191860 [Gigaspora rosea]